jgi:tetratricopeptide (TPR) repeat protein
MKTKSLIFMILMALCTAALFAQRNAYAGADKKTQAALQNADTLIEQRQYATAFGSLSMDNEYCIAKKTEIATNYFLQSMMHQMFVLDNLQEDQDLMELRKNLTGTYNMTYFDPAKIIQEYTEKNGEKPILNYALGLYYSDVLRRYPGQWLISDEELVENTITYLLKAYEKDCWDAWSMSELAYAYMQNGDYETAIKYYSVKLDNKEDFSINDDYNFALCNFFCGNYPVAQQYMEKSVLNYENNPGYLYDTWWVLSAIYINTQQYDLAQKALDNCKSLDMGDYRLVQRYISFYAILKDKAKTLQASADFFQIAPENPSVPQFIIQEYFDRTIEAWLPDFFEQELKRQDLSTGTLQNLYFHYAASLSYLDKKSEAAVIAEKARQAFLLDNSLTDDIDQMLRGFAQ